MYYFVFNKNNIGIRYLLINNIINLSLNIKTKLDKYSKPLQSKIECILN